MPPFPRNRSGADAPRRADNPAEDDSIPRGTLGPFANFGSVIVWRTCSPWVPSMLVALVGCEAPAIRDASLRDGSLASDARDADDARADRGRSVIPDGALDGDLTSDGGEPPSDGATDATMDSTRDPGPRVTIPPASDVLVGFVGTGQSLSVGSTSNPALSTRPLDSNVRLRDTGTLPRYDGVGDELSLVPLIEPVRNDVPAMGGMYPNNIAGETPHAGLANALSHFARTRHGVEFASAHSVVGEGGRPMAYLVRGGLGRAYAASLYETRAITGLARAEGRRYEVGAVVLTHGESDAMSVTYEGELLALIDAYRADLPRITGQRTEPVLILSQQGSFPGAAGRGVSTLAQWRASVVHRGLILCSGPKYQLEYSGDGIHLSAAGSRALGVKYAQVYAQTAFEGRTWRPLEPVAVQRRANTVEVRFFVPVPPLAWETSIPAPHSTPGTLTAWSAGRGFELEQNGAVVGIRAVDLREDTVIITPSTPLAEGAFTVRYAMTQDVNGYTAGAFLARAGQLRDSDPFAGFDRVRVTAEVTVGASTARITAGSLDGHGVRALVHGAGLGTGAVVTAVGAGNTLSLSRPWTDPSGTVELSVQSDQRNYAVQFEWIVR
jgi:hypothetical protein